MGCGGSKKENDSEIPDTSDKRYQEYLLPIEKYSLMPIFEKLNLPKIDNKREKHINSFQLIPIIDLVIIIILIKYLIYFPKILT